MPAQQLQGRTHRAACPPDGQALLGAVPGSLACRRRGGRPAGRVDWRPRRGALPRPRPHRRHAVQRHCGGPLLAAAVQGGRAGRRGGAPAGERLGARVHTVVLREQHPPCRKQAARSPASAHPASVHPWPSPRGVQGLPMGGDPGTVWLYRGVITAFAVLTAWPAPCCKCGSQPRRPRQPPRQLCV